MHEILCTPKSTDPKIYRLALEFEESGVRRESRYIFAIDENTGKQHLDRLRSLLMLVASCGGGGGGGGE